MRKSAPQVLAILLVISTAAVAQLYDVQISATTRKLDQQKDRQGDKVTVTTREIAYRVTVENRTFKTIPELQMKYMIFYVDPKPGSREKPIEAYHKGSETLMGLESNRTATFETNPFKLTKEELDAGWYWAGSEKSRLKDKVTGVWIRAYSNGNLVGEYSNPTTVPKKKEWKE